MTNTIDGLVIRTQSGFYTVKTEKGYFTCELRGRLKKGPRKGDILSIGDRVSLTVLAADRGIIEEIKERTRMFSRLAPNPQGEYQQILISNPDQVVIVFACADPDPRLGMLDRFLVIAEEHEVPSLIVVNKTDLVSDQKAKQIFNDYHHLGYPIIYTSVRSRQGLDELSKRLHSKISLLTGPSGVGKSSLLNAIQPGLGLQVREVSQSTSKGTHTTVVRELFPLNGGGYVADTPGLKALALWDIEPEELDGYFPEFRARILDCQFSDCTHVHEPGCAILDALDRGEISQRRYQSYLSMRFGDSE